MLKLAFNILYSKGYICRVATESGSTVVERAEERRAKGEPVAGAVFTVKNEMASRGEDGSYPLHFGRPKTEKFGLLGKNPEEIGQDVVAAIKRAGGWCEWDGDPEHAIKVKEN